MEFSRGKRILNLVSSTSGNNVKKAKKEIKNTELLLNYCCNKPSTTTSDNTNLINEDDTHSRMQGMVNINSSTCKSVQYDLANKKPAFFCILAHVHIL